MVEVFDNFDSELSFAFTRPDGPDVSPLEIIHRGHNKFVPVYVTVDGEFRPLAAFPAWSLTEIAGKLNAELCVDAYAAVNGFYSHPWNESRQKADSAVLLNAQRKKRDLQYINAVFVDLDCYRRNITPGMAIGALIDAQDSKLVPSISLITRSGRGVWAFWLVRDARPAHEHRGLRSSRLAIPWAESIQRELQHRFEHLGADPQSVDLCRVTRIPGSINSKSDSRVEHWIRRDVHGQVASYTLEELSQWLGVEKPVYLPSDTSGKLLANGLDPREMCLRRWAIETERMRKLIQHRGTIKEGHRGAAVYLYSTFLKRSGLKGTEFRTQVEGIWPHLQNCSGTRPLDLDGKTVTRSREYTRRQFENQLNTQSDAIPSHHQISQLLEITADEADLTGWPARTTEPKLGRQQQQTRRRAIISELTQLGPIPSLRNLVAIIQTTDPLLRCSTRAIRADLRAMGLRTGR